MKRKVLLQKNEQKVKVCCKYTKTVTVMGVFHALIRHKNQKMAQEKRKKQKNTP